MKSVLITKDFRRIDKSRWPKIVKDFIDSPDVNSIHSEYGSKIAYHRFNTDAYPRLMFFEEMDNKGNIIFVIRKYFKTHDDYDRFRKLKIEEQVNKGKYSPAEQSELDDAFARYNEETTKPPLPKVMRDYENKRDFSNTATTYVFEMEEWCRHIGDSDFEDDKKDIFAAICHIIIDKRVEDEDSNGWFSFTFSDSKKIIYRVHEKEKHCYYYLFDIGSNVDMKHLKDKYLELTDLRLLKQARKGYPDWILYGSFEDWKKMENDDEANLALSDEEVNVLNRTPYPYFVNGLAGSGKSTILYYLFAHAYSYKNVKPLDLLFVSYSSKLVQKAKGSIIALLKTNPSYHEFHLTEQEESKVDDSIISFIKFLRDKFIKTEEEEKHFLETRQLSYYQFQTAFHNKCNLVEAKSFSSAQVWFVIRTFIKGRDYKSYYTKDKYLELREREKTVESSDYEAIYKIWENWYQPYCEKNNYWDVLDLVRYVLNKLDGGYVIDKYDIIYCDEAQDFTPIENELILRLSKYTDYDLRGYNKIPIAYAGDPNQTVSPTGFNWKRLKDIFDLTFSELVGRHISLNEKTLNNNYRSKRTIVEFANTLQYIRKCFLTDDVLQPQEQWNPQANPLPGFFFLNAEEGEEDDMPTIMEGFKKIESIITGADGEYEKKSDVNELTEDSTPIEDKVLLSVDLNKLYTAASSKGLEFSSVLLYRFADQLPKSFEKILNNDEDISESDMYELSHFFTKLYIAVTRAKEILYIADTRENFNVFWSHFIDNSFVNDLLQIRQDSAIWETKVGGIVLGERTEFLSRLNTNYNPLLTARKMYMDAKLSESVKDMKHAAGYFEEAGNYAMAEECKAFVLLFEGKYRDSGIKFFRLSMLEEATQAFWKGCCWDELVQYGDNAAYQLAANFMKSVITIYEFVSRNNIVEHIFHKDDTWKQVVFEINKQAKNVKEEYIFDVCQFLEKLVERGFVFLNQTIANLYFRNRKYREARDKWKELGMTEHHSYYEAEEAICTTTSEKIYWMSKGGKNREILSQYSDPKDAQIYMFDDRAKRIVFNLLRTPRTFLKAMNYPINIVNKNALLYETDRIQFIEYVVLEDFAEVKFKEWVEDPITINNSDLFDRELPSSFFEKIFALPQMKDWILFMKLRDVGGYRVMKNAINIHKVAEALCGAISTRKSIALGSCFLDVIFNNPNYNYANANSYISTLLKIFRSNDFSSKDFIAKYKRNRYFQECDLQGHELDSIREKLNAFVEKKIESYRRIKTSDIDTIKTLCIIFEKSAPYKDREKFEYDYAPVLTFYASLQKRTTLPELIKYIEIRKAVLTTRYNGRTGIVGFEKNIPNTVSYKEVIDTFDKEETIWFIRLVLGKKKLPKDVFEKWGILLAKLIYKMRIHLSDFRIKDNLKKNATDLANFAIEHILSNTYKNENSLQLFAYIYEVFLGDDTEKASKYDSLSKDVRLSGLKNLVRYLQSRALHYYSYGDEGRYEKKIREYDFEISISNARASEWPQIEDKPLDLDVLKNRDNDAPKISDDKGPTVGDAGREKAYEIAGNLLTMGIMPDTDIAKVTGLTLDEIRKMREEQKPQ